MTDKNYSGLPRNIFDDSSISAIKNANRYSPDMKRATPVQFQDTFKEDPKQAQQDASVDMQPMFDQVKREFEIKITKQMELIDKVIASQNQMIKEFNELMDRVKRLEARPVTQVIQQAPAQSSNTQAASSQAPAAASSQGPKVSEAATADTSSKTMIKQQTGAGAGLDPSTFSVEKYFYFGK